MTKDKEGIVNKLEEEDIFAAAPDEDVAAPAQVHQKTFTANKPSKVEELPNLDELTIEEDIFESAPKKEVKQKPVENAAETKAEEALKAQEQNSKVESAEEILKKKLESISLEDLGIKEEDFAKEGQKSAKNIPKEEATLEEKLQDIDLSELDDISIQEKSAEEVELVNSKLKIEEIKDQKSSQKLSPKQMAAVKESVLANNSKQINKTVYSTDPAIKNPEKWLAELMELIKNPK